MLAESSVYAHVGSQISLDFEASVTILAFVWRLLLVDELVSMQSYAVSKHCSTDGTLVWL